MNIETSDAGKKIHTASFRNDQVLAGLYLKELLSRFKNRSKALFDLMMNQQKTSKCFVARLYPFTNRDALLAWFSLMPKAY
jgi:argininosuccinate lyase